MPLLLPAHPISEQRSLQFLGIGTGPCRLSLTKSSSLGMFSDPGGRPRGLPVFLVGMLGFELLLIVGYRRLMEKIIDMGLSPEVNSP